ncbi:MAG: xanthine dehydrogenase family protein subunit M [Bacteroidota bacterium]|nr:xanthine dehydrogenase family protein subunit M [Bacteroidota bacterium]
MKQFEYINAKSIQEAAEILSVLKNEARIIAGGTDLLIELRRPNAKTPQTVVDITSVKELKGISESNGSIILKPLATHTEIHKSDLVKKFAGFLGEAASVIGAPQIRNRGTVGGNVMNAATCADTVPALIALGAKVTLHSVTATRTMPIVDFFIKPYKTKANADDILTEIKIPKLPSGAKSAFIKLGRRNALSISRLSVAAVLVQDKSGIITEARIVPGAALPTWMRVTEAERMLIGEKPTEKLFEAAGKKVSEVMISFTGRRWSTEYKEPVIGVLVRRALEKCIILLNEVRKNEC